jgi:hypothetical protein
MTQITIRPSQIGEAFFYCLPESCTEVVQILNFKFQIQKWVTAFML